MESAPPTADPTGREAAWPARLAGLVAAGVALGVGELVSGTSGTGQSLVGSVGNEVIDRSGGTASRTVIDLFGTSDKAFLLTTIVVVCLLLGVVVGQLARSRRWVGPVAFGGFALVGMVAGLRDPVASGAVTVVAALLAAVSGAVTLELLLRIRPRPVLTSATTTGAAGAAEGTPHAGATVPGAGRGDRRAFLAWTGVAGAAAALGAVGGRTLSRRTQVETGRQAVALPTPTATLPAGTSGTVPPTGGLDIPGLTPIVVPNADFYRIDTALVVPRVDVGSWRLRVEGDVDHPFTLTFDELMALPQVEAPVTIACVSNEVGGDLVGNAVWQGVPLSTLLERAGVRPEGTQLVGRSVDGFTVGFPTPAATDGRIAMVAVGMNGEPLPIDHGYPARLVVEGLYGYVSATKWLSAIQLTGWDQFDAYWVPRGWAKQAPIKTQSRIDVPRAGATVDPGQVTVAGVAWAPDRGIQAVQVKVDDADWAPARLGPRISDATWCQWAYTWDASPGEHTLRVRAVDGTGAVQTGDVSRPEPDGATGWHTRRVRVRG